MTQEEKYKEALLEARAVLEPCLKYSRGKVREALDSIDKELKSFESEDEKIRKTLVEYFGPKAQLDFVRGVPIQKIRDWLEKQKEQKPVEPSDDELQRHQDELYDFKVFAAKQAKEHHISFVHDFEWNNFCAELLSYFNEQKPEWSKEDEIKLEGVINDLETLKDWIRKHDTGWKNNPGLTLIDKRISWLKVLLERFSPQPKQEWSEEDEEMLDIVLTMVDCSTIVPHSGGQLHPSESYKKDISDWLKSLRPSWKPSEEQMKALQNAVALTACDKELVRLYNQLKKL